MAESDEPTSPRSPVQKKDIKDLAAELTLEQLTEAREVFALFDADGKGEIGHKELNFALARLGQHPSAEEVDAMIREFDDDNNGTIDFEEFLGMMEILGWNDTSLSESELKSLQVSFYGQASICRWLEDGAASSSGDVTGDDVGPVTRTCRIIAMARPFEMFVYLCIFAAAVISGMQSYKVDSPYEHASWAIAADGVILFIFTAEICERPACPVDTL
jgi:hypothetical protein